VPTTPTTRTDTSSVAPEPGELRQTTDEELVHVCVGHAVTPTLAVVVRSIVPKFTPTTVSEAPTESIVIYDEASITLSARRAMDKEHQDNTSIMAISRRTVSFRVSALAIGSSVTWSAAACCCIWLTAPRRT
jgi:hypothetical protein